MTITFPRTFPTSIKPQLTEFRLARYTNQNRRSGGTVQVSDKDDPKWLLQLTTQPLYSDDYQELMSWISSLKGGINTFLMHDHERPYPRNYRSGFEGQTKHLGGSFDGSALVDAVTATQVTLSGLSSSFTIRAGDYIGLSQSGRSGLFHASEDVTASAGIAAVPVEPFINTNTFSTAATAQLNEPVAEFILESWEGSQRPAREQTPVTIVAIQKGY